MTRCNVCLTILDPDGSCKECRGNPKLRVGNYCEECGGSLYGSGRKRFCSNKCMRRSQNRRYHAKVASEAGTLRPDPAAIERARCIEIIREHEPYAGAAVHDIIRAIEGTTA